MKTLLLFNIGLLLCLTIQAKPTHDSKHYTSKGYIKEGTNVLVELKDGTRVEAKVMYPITKNKYWLNEAGGGRFGRCHIKYMNIIEKEAQPQERTVELANSLYNSR